MPHSHSRSNHHYEGRSPSPERSSDVGDGSLRSTSMTDLNAAPLSNVSLNDIANMLAGLNLTLTLSPTPTREVREYEDAPAHPTAGFRPAFSGARTAPSTPSRQAATRATRFAPVDSGEVAPEAPPQREWVMPGSALTSKPKFYIVTRVRCCGVFWSWEFTEPLIRNLQTGQFWPGVRYRREDDFEVAWAEYQRAKAAGQVSLAARQFGDRDRYGPNNLCIM